MPTLAPPEPPLHGFRGDLTPPPLTRPHSFTVAISRETGARGGGIARRVAERLGWQTLDQEMMGFLSQNDAARAEFLADVPPAGVAWANRQVNRLVEERKVIGPEAVELVRLVFLVAARGETVLVGRGAGILLPTSATLNVRIVAPLAQRVAYIGQWLRLTADEAAAEVEARDRIRSAMHQALANRDPADLTQYDLVLNSGRLTDAVAAELIVAAVRAKHVPPSDADPFLGGDSGTGDNSLDPV
jgi:cytidylate kinase